jgi:hypothetical protein
MLRLLPLLVAAISLQGALSAIHGPQAVNLWKLNQKRQTLGSELLVQSSNLSLLEDEFPDQWFTQPVDHFSKDSTTFGQRYWVNTRHYVPGSGGPVFVLDGGETSGEDRIPFLDTGIVDILCRATGGVGVVLEHRYYGEMIGLPYLQMLTRDLPGASVPVSNFTTDSLR